MTTPTVDMRTVRLQTVESEIEWLETHEDRCQLVAHETIGPIFEGKQCLLPTGHDGKHVVVQAWHWTHQTPRHPAVRHKRLPMVSLVVDEETGAQGIEYNGVLANMLAGLVQRHHLPLSWPQQDMGDFLSGLEQSAALLEGIAQHLGITPVDGQWDVPTILKAVVQHLEEPNVR